MHDIHLLEDGSAIVCDEDLSTCVLDHLVHATGAEGCADHVGDCFIVGLYIISNKYPSLPGC
jgi:hypothetical protein